jgi:hypothetical protein
MRRRTINLLVAGPLAVVVLVTVGTWVYISFIRDDAPRR